MGGSPSPSSATQSDRSLASLARVLSYRHAVSRMPALSVMTAVGQQSNGDWLSDHATLLIGAIGIVVSGIVGPAIAARMSERRERQKDNRAAAAARQIDLRGVVDEAAQTLGGAVAKLRPLLEAEQRGDTHPKEPAEFIGSLFPLGQRLRLRLPDTDPVVVAYDDVMAKLVTLSKAVSSQAAFDQATQQFEAARRQFLEAGRLAVKAPLLEDD
jgi:hypothetical protein